MTANTNEAPTDDRLAAALRLLFGVEIAWICWRLFADQASTLLHLRHRALLTPQQIKEIDFSLCLPALVLFGVTAYSIVRFVTPLGDVWARRWGYTAASFFGASTACYLSLAVLRLVDMERLTPVFPIMVAANIIDSGATALMLLALWKGSRVLALQPPMGRLGAAVGALLLGLVAGIGKMRIMESLHLGDDKGLLLGLSVVATVASAIHPILIAGALGVILAGLRRTRTPAAAGSGWVAAADGLGLFDWGVRGLLAVYLLSGALEPLHSWLKVDSGAIEWGQEVITLVGLVFSAWMLVGLIRYACLPELAGASAYAYAGLTLIILAEEITVVMDKQWLAGLALPASFLLITGSFRRVAQALNEPDLTDDTRKVALWLFVPGSVSSVLETVHALTSMGLITFVAAVCVLVGVILFFLLMGRLRRRMPDGPAPAFLPSFTN